MLWYRERTRLAVQLPAIARPRDDWRYGRAGPRVLGPLDRGITGYRFGGQFGTGSSAVRAEPGQELLIFGFVASTRALTASIVVRGHRQPLPRLAGATAFVPVYYLASLPGAARQVALEVSKDGFTQEFSFTKGEREGAQPSALYDTATDWQITQSFTGEAALSVLGQAGGSGETAHQVILVSTTLTYFLPGTNVTPGGPSEAWLVLKGSTFPFYTTARQGLPHLAYAKPMVGSDLTLSLPGGKPTGATVTATSGPAHGALFDGDYYWRVPASIGLGTLHMKLPPLSATGPASGAPIKFGAKVSAAPVQLNFPSAYEPPPIPASDPPPYVQAAPTSSPLAARGAGVPLVALLLALPTVMAAAGLVVVVVRRRRGLTPAGGPGNSGASTNRGRGPAAQKAEASFYAPGPAPLTDDPCPPAPSGAPP